MMLQKRKWNDLKVQTLAQLITHDQTCKTLSEVLNISRQNAGMMLLRLFKMGLATREPLPTPWWRRPYRYSITRRGEERLTYLRDLHSQEFQTNPGAAASHKQNSTPKQPPIPKQEEIRKPCCMNTDKGLVSWDDCQKCDEEGTTKRTVCYPNMWPKRWKGP